MFDLVGKTLGKYRLLEKLGQGGMAQVYKAYQPDLDRYVAVKILHPHLTGDPEFEARFRREARAVAALEHPHIIRVYDFDTDQGLAFLVMEHVAGSNLKERLHDLHCRGERLDLAEAVRTTGALADALEYAHQRGVVHRDLKPSNVLITPGGRPVLADFGIARMLDATAVSETGSTLGTPAYMSPEQGRGEPADARSDVYALGILLYQLTTGRVPFEADTPYAIILKHITAPLPAPRSICPDLPEALERVILKALAKEPDGRFQTAGEMERRLEEWKSSSEGRREEENRDSGGGDAAGREDAGGQGAEDREAADREIGAAADKRIGEAAERMGRGARARRRVVVGAAVGLVALAVAALLFIVQPRGSRPPVIVSGEGRGVLVLRSPDVKVVDTWLDPDMPDQSWHEADLVHLQGPLTPDRVLLRFEIPSESLPAGGRIVSATLSVRTELWGKQSLPGAAVAYRVLVPWQPERATYRVPWSEPGLAPGWDYDATPLDVQPVPDVGLLTLDVEQAVRAWLERGQPNHGVVIMMAADSHNQAHHWMYLSEQPGEADRPVLQIGFEAGP